MHNNFFGEVVHPRCRLLYLGFSRAPDSRRPEYDSNSRKNRKEIVIYKCNLVCCSFDPTGMESEPGKYIRFDALGKGDPGRQHFL